MWPLRVEKSDFLLKIYGHYPSLDDVAVTELVVSRDGPSVRLSFLSSVLPYKPPAHWNNFNRVSLGMHFVDVSSISISKFDRVGRSRISMWDQGSEIAACCDGATEFDLRFRHLVIDRISGVLSDELES